MKGAKKYWYRMRKQKPCKGGNEKEARRRKRRTDNGKNSKKRRIVLWEVHENERERERSGSAKRGKMNEGMHEWRNKRWKETRKRNKERGSQTVRREGKVRERKTKGCSDERKKAGLRKSYVLDVRGHVFLFQASEMWRGEKSGSSGTEVEAKWGWRWR